MSLLLLVVLSSPPIQNGGGEILKNITQKKKKKKKPLERERERNCYVRGGRAGMQQQHLSHTYVQHARVCGSGSIFDQIQSLSSDPDDSYVPKKQDQKNSFLKVQLAEKMSRSKLREGR